MRFMRASTMLYLAYLVFVSILSCIIVSMWWSTTKLIRQNYRYYAIELRDCLGSWIIVIWIMNYNNKRVWIPRLLRLMTKGNISNTAFTHKF
jgi:uncharacterized membrane protein